jgi:hypothetical protein
MIVNNQKTNFSRTFLARLDHPSLPEQTIFSAITAGIFVWGASYHRGIANHAVL